MENQTAKQEDIDSTTVNSNNVQKLSKRQQKKLQNSENENQLKLTPEEEEKQRAEIFAQLQNPCESCKMKEGKYSLRQVKSVCEFCFQKKIYNRIYLHIRGKIPLNSKLLIVIGGNTSDLEESQKTKDLEYFPLAGDYLVLKTLHAKAFQGNKQFHELEILYIDSSAMGQNKQMAEKQREMVVNQWAKQFDVKVSERSVKDSLFGGDGEKMIQFLKQFKDVDEVTKILNFNLTMQFAQQNAIENIFLSDCGQDIAKNTFALFAQGRGLALLQEINAISTLVYKGKPITVFRMLKDVVKSEVQNAFRVEIDLLQQSQQQEQKVQENELKQEKEEEEKKKEESCNKLKKKNILTVDEILETFFEKLQVSFPSTVHTALRSLDKVSDKFENEKDSQVFCFICLKKVDKIVNQLELDSYEELGKSQVQQIQGICFGCMRMLKNANNTNLETVLASLPEVILENRHQQKQQ